MAGLLALSGLVTGAAAIHAAATSPALALVEEMAPDALGPEALKLRLEAALRATVTADWLARETDAALAERPLNWSRLDALSELATERGLSLPPGTEARRSAALAQRPGLVWACADGALGADLPDHPTAIACHFGAALTVIGDGRDLIAEASKHLAGEEVDALTVALAGAGLAAALAGPAGATVKASAAALRTGRRLGAVSPRLIADALVQLRRAGPRALAGGLADIGRVAVDLGPVTAIRSLRHLDSLDDARKLRRVSDAMGPRTARTFEALGARRVFATLTRVSRTALRLGGLVAAALACVLGALAASGQFGLGRLLGPRRRQGA